MSDRWQQIERIYQAALKRPAAERAAFLVAACPDDVDLQRQVASLLDQPSDGATQTVAGGPPTPGPITPGCTLGPYRIEARIGQGGMGQVFRAMDTRLNRAVAIKTSHTPFDPRFQREARAIATLNHPNICTLYDVGASENATNYLVMELCEGETLAARIKRGALKLDETLKIGSQIAAALAAAHAKGIIHRDLKPANIILTKQAAKVLDFGLAKSDTDLTLTQSHAIMGTPAYMAPEQHAGQPTDHRTDIYALGLVLAEMATGQRPPPGARPDLTSLPAPLAHIMDRCLAPDPASRWQAASDVQAELDWAARTPDAVPSPAVPRRALFPWIAGAAAMGATGGGWLTWALRSQSSSAPTAGAFRFQTALPAGVRLQRNLAQQSLALSPAGNRVAMVATNAQGSMIWVQRLDSLTAGPLSGTEGARMVFWSPDGDFIGFWDGLKLKKIPAEGGTAVTICEIRNPWTATWSEAGVIVTADIGNSSRISVKSGTISPGRPMVWPKFLPGGKHLLYVKLGVQQAYIEELATGRETALMPTDTQVLFVPDQRQSTQGHLLFGRGSTLLAQRFDADRLSVSGDPVPVAKDVPFFLPTGWSEFDASPNGTLIHSSGSQLAQLTWLDRGGRELNAVGEPRDFFGQFRISPDGKKLAADVFDFSTGNPDIWIYAFAQGTSERATSGVGGGANPLWSPEGTRLAFGNTKTGPLQLRVQTVGDPGSSVGFPRGEFQFPYDWSADGRSIFYGGAGPRAIWVASLPDHKLTRLIQTAFETGNAALSPDGRYLAFNINETGRYEVYVQRFEGSDPPRLTGERRRVSRNGGTFPRWRRDGRELFFISPDRQITAVPVKPAIHNESDIEVGTPRPLFRLPPFNSMVPEAQPYDVSLDGQQFLVPIHKAANAPLQVVVNWQALLRKGAA